MADPVIRVLYIDDDVALVRLVQKVLSRSGFVVTHVATAEEAMRHVGKDPIDVVALDHYLKSGTGLEILAQLTALDKTPPVVYVTGSSDMNVAVAALKTGAADFVPKTVGDDFLVLLRSALEQAVEKGRLKAQKEAADEEVRIARDRAEVLLAEVNHRVANSLALVASLVRLQANAMSDPVAKEALGETQARIYAVASVHKRLYSSHDVMVVALDEYLTSLLDHLSASIRSEGHGTSLHYALEPLGLETDASINLGVIVTEWVTNAFKYAYPGGSGEIRVSLRRLPNGRGELAVEDDGVGRMNSEGMGGTGLGTRIVGAMAAGIGAGRAEIEYLDRKPGTAAHLTFTLLQQQ
jgi:two-component sensor histidine kinase/CheY-like chemotaxis protein